jgi:hypothetical protein
VGYAHWKKTAAYRSEADIWIESNPYNARILVNTEIMLKLNHKLTEMLVKQSKNEPISNDELDTIIALQKDFLEHSKNRNLSNYTDVSFFKNIK